MRVEAPVATRRDFLNHFGKWENGKVLLGTSWSWFALDIAFYGLGLNSSIILTAIGFGNATKARTAQIGHARAVYENLHNISVGNLVISVAGLIPGYYATFALVDFVRAHPFILFGFVSHPSDLSYSGVASQSNIWASPSSRSYSAAWALDTTQW